MEESLKKRIQDARLDEMAAREKIITDLRAMNLSTRTAKLFCEKELGYNAVETRQILACLGLVLTTDAMTSSDPVVRIKIEKLKTWRRERARGAGLPAYRVLSNRTLMSMAEVRPTDEFSLLQVKGFGERSARSYGAEILRLLKCDESVVASV